MVPGNFRVWTSLPNGLSPLESCAPPNKIISVRGTRQSFYLKPPTPLLFSWEHCVLFYFTSSSSDLQMWNFKCRVLKKKKHMKITELCSQALCVYNSTKVEIILHVTYRHPCDKKKNNNLFHKKKCKDCYLHLIPNTRKWKVHSFLWNR